MQVKDVMSKEVVSVSSDMDLHRFAELLIEKNISGAPVVDADDNFLGVALEEGLIFQDKKVHLPTFIHLSLGFLTLETQRFEEEIKKIAATKVSDILEEDCVTVRPDIEIEEVATMMIEKGLHYYPVVEEGKVVGVVTKKDIVRAIAQGKL